ncbi:MAG: DUF1993 domain-containing protein [Caulobacterales bacterium]|nr:DUF1993 domain-containing protein [Caulobacterales bacterium]
MAVSIYDVSIPVYQNMLKNLAAFLDKAEAHAKSQGKDPADYLAARLAPDMATLTAQVQFASDAAKSGAARLAGVTPPSFPDTETTWEEVKARIAKTLAFLEGVTPAQLEGAEDRTIELKFPSGSMTFSGRDFVTRFSLPNFLFHVTTAYGILRSQGVPLAKMDFLAGGAAG